MISDNNHDLITSYIPLASLFVTMISGEILLDVHHLHPPMAFFFRLFFRAGHLAMNRFFFNIPSGKLT
jgi:hypothetical protein